MTGRCCRCKSRFTSTNPSHRDHIVPRSWAPFLPGYDLEAASNIQRLCGECNLWKGNREAIDYRCDPPRVVMEPPTAIKWVTSDHLCPSCQRNYVLVNRFTRQLNQMCSRCHGGPCRPPSGTACTPHPCPTCRDGHLHSDLHTGEVLPVCPRCYHRWTDEISARETLADEAKARHRGGLAAMLDDPVTASALQSAWAGLDARSLDPPPDNDLKAAAIAQARAALRRG